MIVSLTPAARESERERRDDRPRRHVFTIEPGRYEEQIGGFRHSDTVAVTPDGIDILTRYPSDLKSLTIPR